MQFEIVDPCFDEDLTPIDILTPHEYVEENAMQKALSVAKDYIFSEMPLTREIDCPMWKRKIRDLLDYHEGAIEVIDGKLKKPESIDADAQESVRKQHKERCDLYRKANSYAKLMIASTVTDAVYQKIMDKETAFEAWESLRKHPCGIKAAGNETLAALGKDTIKVKSTINGKCQEVVLKDVCYVPKINRNLFSVLAAQDRNPDSEFVWTPTECWLKINDDVVLYGSRNLYHERWGHQDKRHIRNMLEKELGIHIKLDKKLCEPCIYGKAHRLSFGTREKASEPGELISADVCGPFDESFQKKKYLVVFKDSFTKFLYGYLIKEKSEVKKVLEHMLAHTRTLGYSVKEFLCDNGGEFDNKDVHEILHSNGIT
ncbi:retrovirus-related Pol polyprotein from transposon TNT 1-94 [Trichonephila clavipes]|nr:retrovirus-related Pol polyprotein from transposon TNT 1-94 [Trichonephila clavipes]